ACVSDADLACLLRGFYCHAQWHPGWGTPGGRGAPVKVPVFQEAATSQDVTAVAVVVPKSAQPSRPGNDARDASEHITLEDAGFPAQPPIRKYELAVRADLRSIDGQVLGYPWIGIVDTWHRSAFTSFGDGHGVWEKDGGATLPFYSRNFRDVRQWAARIEPTQLMPTLQSLQDHHFDAAPSGEGISRRLSLTPDRVQSHGLDLSRAL